MNMHIHELQQIEQIGVGPYDILYASSPDNILWGETPSRLIDQYLKLSRPVGSALDVGCGDGVNALALEKRGFDVLGVEVSSIALAGLRNRFRRNQCVPAGRYINEDVARFLARPAQPRFDLVVSCGLFHCLSPRLRVQQHRILFERFLSPAGWVAFSTLTDRVPWPDDHEVNDIHLATRAEVTELFAGWTIVHSQEGIIQDCHPPLVGHHEHSVSWTLARRDQLH